MHGCDCSHSGQSYVREEIDEGLVWEGYVETFDLVGHAEASKAFAWGLEGENGSMETFTILNIPPVHDPRVAVKTARASEKLP